MTKPDYPEVLKKAGWDKQKGVIAKLTKGETGVGAALDGLFAAYTAVPWEKLDPAAGGGTPEGLKKAFTDGKTVLTGQIEAARKKSFAVGDLAKKVAADFKNPLLKGSKDYLTKMADQASNFATIMRDSAMAGLKQMQDHVELIKTHAAEIKTLGEDYIQNRKLAAVQMKGIQTLFTEAKTRITQEAATADAAAKEAVATPSGAGAAVVKIEKIVANCETIATTAKEKFKKEGAVNTNPIQAKARGNIGVFTKAKELSPMLQAYQTQSAAEFNAIMGSTAAIINLSKDLDALLSNVHHSLNVAKDAADTGVKGVGEYLSRAKAGVASALELAGKQSENNRKLHEGAKRLPKVIVAINNPKSPEDQIKTAPNMAETTVGEIQRRMADLQNAASQIINIQKRLLAMPAPMQQEKAIAAELTKLDKIVKQMEAALKLAAGLDTQAIKDQATILQLLKDRK